MTKHRSFTDEFKRDAVKRASEPGVNKSALAKTLEISGNILHRWIRESQAPDAGAVKAKPGRPRRQATQTQEGGSVTAAKSQGSGVQGKTTGVSAQSTRGGNDLASRLAAVNAERAMLKKTLSRYVGA